MNTIIGFYFLLFFFLSIFGVHRSFLVWRYYHKRKGLPVSRRMDPLPAVTIQLPVYNEAYVVERLITAVSLIDYPKNLLHIQVLDDSTDETSLIAEKLADKLKAQGLDICYIHRSHRRGFKAGALANGLSCAKGDFIAVFDADFIPTPGFLKDTIHYFSDDNVGMVQARWDYINRNYSLLTRIQAILLDGHFTMEHGARFRSGLFFNFNGTAGLWRKSCIEDAGGWQYDTLTEDLDLSYRAQLKGWQFVYAPNITVWSEIPVEMNAFKSQQHRWAKGSAQTAKKLLGPIIRAPIPLKVKVEAVFHLTSNFAYLCMTMLSIVIFPALIARIEIEWPRLWIMLTDIVIFMLATGSVCSFYILSQRELRRQLFTPLILLPVLMAVGIGISLNNAKAVLEALFNIDSPFERTPKYSVNQESNDWKRKRYQAKQNSLPFIELFLGVYFTGVIVYIFHEALYGSLPFLLIFQFGFLYAAFMSLFQRGLNVR